MLSRLLILASLVPSLALAQEEGADVSVQGMPGMPGMNVNVRVKDGSGKKGTATVREEQKGDGFRMLYETDPNGDTWFKVLSPDGAQIRVIDDVGFPKASGTVPVSFQAQGNKFYQVEIRTKAGAFTRKFEAKTGMVAQLFVGAVTGSAPAPEPVAVPAGACGPEAELAEISGAISDESFSAGKLRVLGDAASSRGFCVDHVVKLLALFDFEGDKISALKLVAPRITDRQNNFKIYKALDFDSTRDQAKKILK